MTYALTGYQDDLKHGCYRAYNNGARNVMPVCATGSGKTVLMGNMAHEYDGYGCSIAHRSILVGQMSVALAREGLRHDIIAPDSVIRTIVGMHMDEIGRSYFDQRAKWKVASVDTIIKRELPATWTKQVGMVHMDEGHHVLADNKWGRALQRFENAFGLFPTATPERADRKGLGRHAHGVIDAMVEGPSMRWLIDNGYLTNYHVLMPLAEDLDLAGVDISADGDYNKQQVAKRVKASRKIVGDVVDVYLQYCHGLKGITFAVDVEHANDIAKAFNAKGVVAVVVTADTPESERREIMRRFKNGDIMQLVNVDLFGEGMDVPAVQVVSMARPTASYGLFSQQFGRALRLLVSPILRAAWHTYTSMQRLQHIAESAKPRAWVIDHVGNIITHGGTPDLRTRPWTLDAIERKRSASDGIPLRACVNPMCLQPYLRIFPACPHCGTAPPEPADRSKPEFVDGDMHLYSPELLEELFGKKKKMDTDWYAVPPGASPEIAGNLRKIHEANRTAQHRLRAVMALLNPPNMDERVTNRKFFHMFGIDTLTAQGLKSADADELRQRIMQKITGALPNE